MYFNHINLIFFSIRNAQQLLLVLFYHSHINICKNYEGAMTETKIGIIEIKWELKVLDTF